MEAASSRPPAPEKVIFAKFIGEPIAEPRFSDNALLNTYESLVTTLTQIRTWVLAKKGVLPFEELKNKFGRTELGKAADDKHWREWIPLFAKEKAAPGNAALVFLEDKTGQTRKTIKKRCSGARKARNGAQVTTVH
jgi:hypothetical protein